MRREIRFFRTTDSNWVAEANSAVGFLGVDDP